MKIYSTAKRTSETKLFWMRELYRRFALRSSGGRKKLLARMKGRDHSFRKQFGTKQKIFWWGIGVIVVFIVLIIVVRSRTASPTQTWCVSDQCFTLEIADTVEERVVGLMHRSRLDTNKGMVFVFQDASLHNFWMKDTLIPLDIIWLDKQYTIVDIQEATPCPQNPCEIYKPVASASYVIELNQGTTKNLGIELGDTFTPKD